MMKFTGNDWTDSRVPRCRSVGSVSRSKAVVSGLAFRRQRVARWAIKMDPLSVTVLRLGSHVKH